MGFFLKMNLFLVFLGFFFYFFIFLRISFNKTLFSLLNSQVKYKYFLSMSTYIIFLKSIKPSDIIS